MINERAIRQYLLSRFPEATGVDIRWLGAGVQGAGFLIEICTDRSCRSYVVKALKAEGLGHDYPSDRAGVFLLDLDEFGNLPRHVQALDVLAELGDGSIKSIGGGIEYYLLMERAEGTDYFTDLRAFASKERLEARDAEKIRAMTSYLADVHQTKRASRALYLRKIRDTIGHGECLMGVFDTYPEGVLSYAEMAAIEKACVDWRAKLKGKGHRLCRIHGDFHPGNVWFKEGPESGQGCDFVLLDRSRGPWGDAADDVTALTINYIFFSIVQHGSVKGAYRESLELFFGEYLAATGDRELLEVLAPFFAFRGVVVANPLFYPEVTDEQRAKIFSFVRAVLAVEKFEFDRVNEYIGA
jgi:aminoglycoside phosphotransferase (APT) family kinase protein